MMHTENRISIDAPASTIFALAQDVSRWPELLPHYRYVTVHREEPLVHRRLVRMGARRGIVPVSWTSEQVYDPEAATIAYRHVAGITRGMEVEWRIVSSGTGSAVSISHALTKPSGLLRLPFATWVAATLFVRPIANRTLRWIKAHAESAARPVAEQERVP